MICFFVTNLPQIKPSIKEKVIWTDVAFSFMPGATPTIFEFTATTPAL
jgi:hypothetical protein